MRKIVLSVTVLLLMVSGPCFAQQYQDWAVGGGWNKSFSMGFNLAMPYVAGVDISSQFSPRISVGLGFGYVPDLVTFGGQARFNILDPAADKTIPVAGAGINQYWIEDGGKSTEAVAINVLFGAEHFFGSELSLGMHIGYITTITESSDNSIKVWGINDDMSKLFFGITGRYYF
jgi:hypothetical protein